MINRETTNDLDILNRIDEIEDQDERFQALLSLAPNLAPEFMGKALKVAEKIKSLARWNEVLIAMAPDFTHELFLEILNTPMHYANREATLINLSSHIPPTLFTDALKITREINKSNISAAVLNKLIPRIEDPIVILEALSVSGNLDSSVRAKFAFDSRLQQRFQQRLDLLQEAEALKLADNFLSAKNYHACAQTLVNLIPYLSSNSLLQALEIARSINDKEASNSRINSLAILNHNILENHLNASDNNSLYADWYGDSEKWKRRVAENFQKNLHWIERSYSEWMWMERRHSDRMWMETSQPEDIYATNLAVWRAIGNEVIDKIFCQAPRSRAKVLALLYYYFEGSQQTQIFEELLEAIEEIPAQSCKARSYITLVLHLPYPSAIKITKRALLIVKEIYEDIINNDLRDSRVELDAEFQSQDHFVYTEVQNGYTKIQRLENQFHTLTISNLKREILRLIEIADSFLFPYPNWWEPNMIEGLLPALIALEKTSESRYADFTFYNDPNGSKNKVSDGHALRCEQWYQLEVAVRGKPTGVPSQEQERHPIREPKQKEPVTIIIAAEGDGFEIKEPIQTLILPPKGDSTENAYFQVRPLHRTASDKNLASVRIRAYYKFNLLEVSVIQAEVVGKFDDSSQSKLGLEKPISFRQERLEREYLDFDEVEPKAMHIDITKQNERFLFNFAFYNNLAQKVEFTAPIYLPTPDLEDALLTIRKTWYDIAMSKTFTERVEGDDEEFLANIHRLAKAGRNLWTKLFQLNSNNSMYKVGKWLEDNPLQKGAIIQVSLAENATEFVFPWTLIYDRKVPREKYMLPDPEGFWGLRYCIEQQLPNQNKGTDKPVQIQNKLRVGFMLWEQFRNANMQKALMENWIRCNPDKLEITTPPITDADDCYALLEDCDAHILYFYTHGYTRHRQADIGVEENLQLFTSRYERLKEDDPRRGLWKFLYESVKQDKFEPDRSWIELTYGRLYLNELYENIKSKLTSKPLVFLNMCESAQITPSLSESFIHFFINRGAKGVIGTECPMTVEFAHPFSERFLGDLLTGETVGNALLNARCYFMELKNPLGLAYTLFGSATTCFEPAILKHLIMPGTTSASTANSSDF